jgi:CDP-glycerol glycerophosphotransferase (TagB/SpsB family)
MVFFLRLLKNLVLLIINFLERFIPRDNKIWLYGGFSDRFIDNSKYLFISLNESERSIKHIWMTNSYEEEAFLKSKGFLCYRKKTIKGIYYSLRASVYIYGAYPGEVASFALSGGAFLFNLWHGIPLKKIEYDIKLGPLKKLYYPEGIVEKLNNFSTHPTFFKKSDAVLCPLTNFKEIFGSAFKLDLSNVCLASYPRVAPFFWEEDKLMRHVEKYEPLEMKALIDKCKQFERVWIYMPTWRDTNTHFIEEAIPDFKVLNEVCKKQGVLFLLKLHLATKITFDKNKFENVVFVPNYFDVYPLLPFTTTLLTDYSSVFLDYQLLNKSIIFYPFDLEEYLSKCREMYFEYDDLAVGNKAYSFKDLINFLNKNENIVSTNSIFIDDEVRENEGEQISTFIRAKIGLLS